MAAVSLFMSAITDIYAQGNFDLDSKQNIILKRSSWSQKNDDDTNNINIEVANKAKRSVKHITFEIVANDERGTRLRLDNGYSKKLSSKKALPANSAGTYCFRDITSLAIAPEEIQISNIYVNYEDGSVEKIRLEVK